MIETRLRFKGRKSVVLRLPRWSSHPPCLSITSPLFFDYRIVNSELSHFKSALSSLENTTAFGSTLFDVWTVNR